ncbi:hypothetical protein KUTeg_008918 [Tegillarca granosa]|uniref:Outer dynein arm-docking complex subunit 4 n=1 Tax=Tegillarca granosa TaxID=220873 RepID=A0ABQ9FD01_TEGGR|nr:hypothetical protein KUTeg_008918 [Tegillarca granosa]
MKPFSTKLSPKSDQVSLKSARTTARSTRQRKKNPFIYSTKTKSHNIYQKTDVMEMDIEEKRIQEALGQMYNDKEYLERLVQEAEKLSKGSADMCTLAEKGLNFLYDRVLFWVRQENGIPLDTKITLAESIEKQLTGRQITQPFKFDSGLHVYGNSIPLSGIHQENMFVQKPVETRKQSTKKDKIQSIRTCNTGFSEVLSGQKVEIMCNENKKKTETKKSLLTYGQQQSGDMLIQKDVRSMKDLDNIHNLSDNDSGINLSFSTCRENSDPDQFDPIQIRTIQEEYLTPIQSPDKKILKQRKNIERRVLMFQYFFLAFIGGRYKDCVARARPVLTALNRYNEDCEESLPNSISIEAKLHSYIGNAAIEMRDYPTALHHHQRDLEIGEDWLVNDEVIVSRALGNLGRIFVFKNKHQEALELFSRKIPLCKSNVETAWLYHEIGNCFLVLSQYAFAKEAARRSIEAADAEEQCSYQLQSCVLKGVAEVKLKEYHAAFNTFERAMKQARRQGDETAEESIREALLDVNERILEEIRAKDQCEERQKSRNSFLASRMMEALPEIRELTSFDIYEDEGPVSLSDTRCDTYDLYSEIGPLETAMTGSFPRIRTVSSMSRITPDTRRLSTCNHPQSERDKDRRSVFQPSRNAC